MSLSFELELRMAIKTGKVRFGSKEAIKALKHGKAKMVIIAANAPKEIKDDILYYAKLSKIPVYIFQGTSVELGTICGKPFMVSAITIYDEGDSRILEFAEGGEAIA
ncbi:MAG: 50S ribosomal protein L30e [Thermoprotei archaeon]|nr:50S ribosomal protein L30e [Thermoprotei archaeon]